MLKSTEIPHILSSLHPCKRVNGSVYILKEQLELASGELFMFSEEVFAQISANVIYNLLKFSEKEYRISFLNYPQFFEVAHPELHSYLTINLETGKSRAYTYRKPLSRPIFHRKETMIPKDHPQFEEFADLTRQEEEAGLFKNTKVISTRGNWEHLLEEKGLSIDGHTLHKTEQRQISKTSTPIKRHKTAIKRYDFSSPVKTLFENNLLSEGKTLFDYGCGKGDDLFGLEKMGFTAWGWDPVFRPDGPQDAADIVNLGFVINVIENPIERAQTLQKAFESAKELLVVSAMLDTTSNQSLGANYKDGIITSRNTFQKYYDQKELGQYIEDVLETTAIAAKLGVYYVFKTPKAQQQFLEKRTKRYIDWASLSQSLYPDRPEREYTPVNERLYEEHKELLDDYWASLVELGRIPKEGEFSGLEELKEKFSSPKKAKRFFIQKYGEKTLEAAFNLRKDDLLVFMAMSLFRRVTTLSSFPESTQADIKSFFGSFKNALMEAKNALFSTGNPGTISTLCDEANVGYCDEQALFFHRSLLTLLPPILRIYVSCGELLYGDISNTDVLKIHKLSGKLTLLSYDDFEGKDLPKLELRVKINLRKLEIDIFNYVNYGEDSYLEEKEKFLRNERK